MSPIEQIIRPPVAPLQPGAYSAVDASQLSPGDLSGVEVLALVGDSRGGQPNTPLKFTDAYQIRQVLRAGPLYDAARVAFGAGASPLVAVRAGATITQGTKALAGAVTNPVTLTSLDWGVWTNAIQALVEANNKVTITYTDPSGNAIREVFDLGTTATAQQVVDAINGKTPGIAKSTLVSAAVTAGTMPLTVAGATPLTGGADGAAIDASAWTAALVPLEAEDVDIVVAVTGDATVHAQVNTHCENMSVPLARKERTQLAGGVLAETPTQAAARATALNKRRSQLVYPGIYEYNDLGESTLYAPFIAAAKEAAYKIAQHDPAQSRIHGAFGALDVERKLSTLQGGDLDVLLRAGVAPIAKASTGGGFWIVDDLSSAAADVTYRDFPKVRSADAVQRRYRRELEAKFVGRKNLAGQASDVRSYTNTISDDLKTEELLTAFKDAVVTPAGATGYNVSVPVMLVDATKFIFINVVLQSSSTVNRSAVADVS